MVQVAFLVVVPGPTKDLDSALHGRRQKQTSCVKENTLCMKV